MSANTRALAKEQTLGWVNEQRRGMGLPVITRLPRSQPGQPHNCVIQRAFRDSPYGTPATTGGQTIFYSPIDQFHLKETVLAHPAFVEAFVFDYDQGRYPELVAHDPAQLESAIGLWAAPAPVRAKVAVEMVEAPPSQPFDAPAVNRRKKSKTPTLDTLDLRPKDSPPATKVEMNAVETSVVEEAVATQERIIALEQQLDGLQSSHEATAKELRTRIRKLEEQAKKSQDALMVVG